MKDRPGWALGLIGCGLAYVIGSSVFLMFGRDSLPTLYLGSAALLVGLLSARRR